MTDASMVSLGDVRLFVRQLGRSNASASRPPVLVAHGGPDWDHAYLLPGLEPLARTHHVVVFDWRGCGRSSRDLPLSAYHPDLVVADVSRLIEWLGVPMVDFVGFSTGGRIAVQLVDEHPDLVRRLVLASTSGYRSIDPVGPSLEAEYRRRLGMQSDEVEFETDKTYERAARNGAPMSIWNLNLMPDYQALLDQVHWSGEWGKALAAGLLPPFGPEDGEAVLRSFGRPVLILHGEQDLGFPVSMARRLHAGVPGSVLAIVEEAGHMAQFEHPETWAGHLRAFL